MRIFFSVAIAFLLTILAAGTSLAQTMDNPCHEKMQGMGVMAAGDMANCCCCSVTEAVTSHAASDILGLTDCCSSEECGGLLLTKDAALSVTFSPSGLSGLGQTPAFLQPMPWVLLGNHFTGLPPPRLPATPRYIQHCSFLI